MVDVTGSEYNFTCEVSLSLVGCPEISIPSLAGYLLTPTSADVTYMADSEGSWRRVSVEVFGRAPGLVDGDVFGPFVIYDVPCWFSEVLEAHAPDSRAAYESGRQDFPMGVIGYFSLFGDDEGPPGIRLFPSAVVDDVGDDFTGDARDEVWLRQFFEFELCNECGLDADAHVVGPDPLDKRHAWCRAGQEG